MKAQKCPVCNGAGKVKGTGLASEEMVRCHGCRGQGWISLPEDKVYPKYGRKMNTAV